VTVYAMSLSNRTIEKSHELGKLSHCPVRPLCETVSVRQASHALPENFGGLKKRRPTVLTHQPSA
jgi:hypothetical protein